MQHLRRVGGGGGKLFETIGKAPAKGAFNHFAIGIVGFAFLFIAGLWLSVEILNEKDYDEAFEKTRRESANLARVFEEHTIRTLGEIDKILFLIMRQFEAEGDAMDLPGLWAKLPINPDILLNAIITDPSGRVILASSAWAPISLSDREHINTHFTSDSGRMFLGKLAEDPITGQWMIPISRRANKPGGSLIGVVSVSINPSYFSDLYQGIDIGTNGVLTLVGLDGFLRARRDSGASNFTLDISQNPAFKQAIAEPQSYFVAVSPVDGIERLMPFA